MRRGRACSGGEVLALTADIPTGDTLRQLAWPWVDERLGIVREQAAGTGSGDVRHTIH